MNRIRAMIGGGFLEGRKTYILGAMMALQALSNWAVGDASLGDALPMALEGLTMMSIRAGIAKAADPKAHRDRLRALVVEMLDQARADDPSIPEIDPERLLRCIESGGPKP
jgi:hypothetical protein